MPRVLNPHHVTAHCKGFRASRTYTPTRLPSHTPLCQDSQQQQATSNAMVVNMQANRVISLLACSYISHPFAPQQSSAEQANNDKSYCSLQSLPSDNPKSTNMEAVPSVDAIIEDFLQKPVKIRSLPNYYSLIRYDSHFTATLTPLLPRWEEETMDILVP
jgi:hypothetical protein